MTTTINGVTIYTVAPSLTGKVGTAPTATNTPQLVRLGSYATTNDAGTGASPNAEVVAYDKTTAKFYVQNTNEGHIEIVTLAANGTLTKTGDINLTALDSYGGVNSVAVHNGLVAVAYANANGSQPGRVVLFDGNGSFIKSIVVGIGPDQVVFTADGTKLLVANEAEMAGSAGTPIPTAGGISIIDIPANPANASVRNTISFDALNNAEAQLRSLGLAITPGQLAGNDIEPEYITISADGTKAYVALQEVNGIAVIDLTDATATKPTAIQPLGAVNHSLAGNEFDGSDRDGPGNTAAIKIGTTPSGTPIYGLLQPDAVASFTANGATYLITANEGDQRVISGVDDVNDVNRLSAVPNNLLTPELQALKSNPDYARLNVVLRYGDTNNDGVIDQLYTLGGRGVSIFKQEADGSFTKVRETGGEFEKFFAANAAARFNNDQVTGNTPDDRSDNKGPEPEGITVGSVGGRTYAFIGLERQSGVMVYDVTDPANASFESYIPPLAGSAADLGPEVLKFIHATENPTGKPLLATANEVANGGLTLYAVENAPFTLQLLHLSDGEAGLLASTTAPNLAALVDAYDDDFTNTLILSGGDNFLPGPFLNGGTDLSLKTIFNQVTGSNLNPSDPNVQIPIAAMDIVILNAIGVEASALGNHDFDLGSRVLADVITPVTTGNTYGGALFPYLSANLDFSGDNNADFRLGQRFTNTVGNGATPTNLANTLAGRVAPAAVVVKDGEKIGLIGATTQLLESISSPTGTEVKGFPTGAGPNGEDDNMTLLAQQLQPIIDEMIAEGINKIIIQSHLQLIGNEELLATKLHGVDIILAAGSNTRMGDGTPPAVAFPGHDASFQRDYPIQTTGTDGKPILIVSTDSEYTYLGRFVVDFDANGDLITSSLTSNAGINGAYASTAANVAAAWGVSESQLATTAFADGTKGDKVEKLAGAVQQVINTKDGSILGFTDVYLEGDRAFIRNQETNLGDLASDANRFVATNALPSGTFVASLQNGGGIRAQIGSISEPDPVTGEIDKLPPSANPDANKPEGAVSQLDVENSLRFNNRLMVFDTTPQGLLNILNWGAGVAPNSGGFPQIGGVSYSYDPDLPGNTGASASAPGAVIGSRILDVALIGADGNVIVKIVDNGVVLPGAPPKITVVVPNFTANDGDGYPIKVNGENFRFILTNGQLSGPINESLNFTATNVVPANALGQQDAFAQYIDGFHGTAETAYDQADTPQTGDLRIQNVNVRADTILGADAPHWGESELINPHPAGWLPSGIGDFNADASSDLAWFNSTTRNIDIWKLVDGQWAGSADVGAHPAGWQPVGFGDFNHDGTSDIAWHNPTTNAIDIWNINNGQWAGSVDVGTHPAGWQPVLTGDFNGDGTSDIVWRNPTTNAIDIWKISNGQWAGSVDIGPHPAGWQPVLTGDFNGDGTSDIAWHNPTTNSIDIWKIDNNGQWAGSNLVGAHPAGWQPLGTGDFNVDGIDDIVWYNPTTNGIDIWKVNNGQWAGSIDVGTHPGGSVPVGVGDFDHNGVSDIMWRNTTTGQIDNWMLVYS